MTRFLFATMPAAGHVTPGLPVARELADRGHEVHWYTGAVYREAIEAVGATHHPILSAYDFGGLGIDEAFPELTGLTGLTMVRQALQRTFIDSGPGMLRDLEAILADFPADVAVSEALFVATRWLHEFGGPPWATLGESMLGTYSRDTAPFGPGLFPRGGPLGRARNVTMNALHRRVVFGPVSARYEQARAEVGLPPLGRSFLDTLTSPFLYLQGTVPSFEYPRSDLPDHLHFVGPLLPDPPDAFTPPSWWGELQSTTRPIVLVTQGTVANDPRLLIAPAITALADEPVLVIATTGAPVDAALRALGGKLPANARLEPFIPYSELLPARVRARDQRRLRRAAAGAVPRRADRRRRGDRGQAGDRRPCRLVGRGPAAARAEPGAGAHQGGRAAALRRGLLRAAGGRDRGRDGHLRRAPDRRRAARAARRDAAAGDGDGAHRRLILTPVRSRR